MSAPLLHATIMPAVRDRRREISTHTSIILNISNRLRRSPPEPNPHSVHGGPFSVGHSGRTVLPPISSGFASSYPDPQLEAAPSRMSPSRNDNFSPSFISGHWTSSGHAQMAGHPSYPYSPFELDQRYPSQSQPPPFPVRQSPPPGLHGQDNLRRVPPISIPQPREDLWAGDPGHINSYPSGFSLHAMSEAGPIHSPSSSYPVNYDPPYHPNMHANSYPPLYPSSMDSRHLPHPHAMHFSQEMHQSSHRNLHPSEWGGPQRTDTHLVSPYARTPRDALSHSPQEPSPIDYPVVKKKRKRADAAQLKILNEVYARTAFPTTEERMELAKKLDMSARSVQIWFQNKRQSTRQSRSSANTLPPMMHHPYAASSSVHDMGHPGVEVSVSSSSRAGSYPSRSPGTSSRQAIREPSPRPPPDAYRRGRSPDDSGRSRRPGGPSY